MVVFRVGRDVDPDGRSLGTNHLLSHSALFSARDRNLTPVTLEDRFPRPCALQKVDTSTRPHRTVRVATDLVESVSTGKLSNAQWWILVV